MAWINIKEKRTEEKRGLNLLLLIKMNFFADKK